MEEDIEVHFRPFRRYCMILTTQPSIPVLQNLNEIILKTDPNILQCLQEYIMLPMQIYLKSPSLPENYTISVLNFVRDFYRRITLTSTFLMTDLLRNLLPMITPEDLQASNETGSNNKNVRISLSEDMKIAICSCLATLIEKSDDSVKADVIYKEDYKLQISHLVFQVLEWSEKEEIKNVVLESLNLVNALCYNKCISGPINQTRQDFPNIEQNINDSFVAQFTQMLPGITSRLIKVIQLRNGVSNEKPQSFKIKSSVLMVWGNYVCAILNDKNVTVDDIIESDFTTSDMSKSKFCDTHLLRNTVWVGKAQDHLLQHLQLFTKYGFLTSEKLHMRNMMLLVCENTIKYCADSLKCMGGLQIEILSCLSVDADSIELARQAERCLETFLDTKRVRNTSMKNNDTPSQKVLLNDELYLVAEQAQTKLFEISESLLKSTSCLYEEQQLDFQLAQLHGFLVLLKNVESSSLFFHSETYLGKLLDAMLSVVKLEENVLIGDDVLRDYSDFDFVFNPELYLQLGRQPKAFRHLSNEKLRKRTNCIAKLLSKCANVNLLVEHLTKNLIQNPDEFGDKSYIGGKYRRETVYLLNEIIDGIDTNEGDDQSRRRTEEILDLIVETYLDFGHFQAISDNQPEAKVVSFNVRKQPNGTREENDFDLTDKCLVIEGLGSIALAAQRCGLEKQFMSNHLGEILVFILAETNLHKSRSAHVLYHALNDLAKAVGSFSDIASMLTDNLDYLCRELAILLRKHLSASSRSKRTGLNRPEGLPTLLKAVLKIQNSKVHTVVDLPELRDTVEVLLRQLDLSWIDPDKSITTEILQVINIFIDGFQEKSSEYDKSASESAWRNVNCEKGALTQLVKDLMASDELENSFLEDTMEQSPCPEMGFHNEERKESLSSETEDETPKIVSDKIKFLRQTVEHTRHFISMVACPQWQLLSLGIAIQK